MMKPTQMIWKGVKEPIFVDRVYDGSLNFSSRKKGRLVKIKYMGYSKNDAMKKFRSQLKKVL